MGVFFCLTLGTGAHTEANQPGEGKKMIYLIFVVFLVTASITVGGLLFFKDCFKHNLINLSNPLVIVVKVEQAEIVTATNKLKSFCGFLLNIFHINE